MPVERRLKAKPEKHLLGRTQVQRSDEQVAVIVRSRIVCLVQPASDRCPLQQHALDAGSPEGAQDLCSRPVDPKVPGDDAARPGHSSGLRRGHKKMLARRENMPYDGEEPPEG